ncbi:MAG TPA: integrase arm-type DNA-binding domain-containing protein, partial [Candidatus Cybelea sp.]|nr:integrase arm-type DNA-binding domain-containing protein [Candidatus Cybelea sp.]
MRAINKLTEPGRYAIGHGAYLQISEWKTRAWVFRYARDGKAHHIGMGSADYVSLSEARERAIEYRRMLARGEDPLEQKRGEKRAERAERERARTFKECALEYVKQHEDGWRGDASRRQWLSSLETHAFPKIGDMLIGEIDVAAVLAVLDPMHDIAETQKRVRTRIAAILDWAAARDLRTNDNPARRPKLLPQRKRAVVHFASLPYTGVSSFMVELAKCSEISARALEFAILTAARPKEAIGARWSEIDLAQAIWTVPGERMKSGREHRVPLSARAVELLASLPRESGSDIVFIGTRTGREMYPMALAELLKRMGHAVTAHGFRATFKTWASERTNYAREIIEGALAHVVGDGTEQAYNRGDALARRRQLMESWS